MALLIFRRFVRLRYVVSWVAVDEFRLIIHQGSSWSISIVEFGEDHICSWTLLPLPEEGGISP